MLQQKTRDLNMAVFDSQTERASLHFILEKHLGLLIDNEVPDDSFVSPGRSQDKRRHPAWSWLVKVDLPFLDEQLQTIEVPVERSVVDSSPPLARLRVNVRLVVAGQQQLDVLRSAVLRRDHHRRHLPAVSLTRVDVVLCQVLQRSWTLARRCVVNWLTHYVVLDVELAGSLDQLLQEFRVRVYCRGVHGREHSLHPASPVRALVLLCE